LKHDIRRINGEYLALVLGKDGSLHEEFRDEKGDKLRDTDGNIISLYGLDPKINSEINAYIAQHNSWKTFSVAEIYLP
jgi:hypothetical protein